MFVNHMLIQLFTEFSAVNSTYCLPGLENRASAHTYTCHLSPPSSSQYSSSLIFYEIIKYLYCYDYGTIVHSWATLYTMTLFPSLNNFISPGIKLVTFLKKKFCLVFYVLIANWSPNSLTETEIKIFQYFQTTTRNFFVQQPLWTSAPSCSHLVWVLSELS